MGKQDKSKGKSQKGGRPAPYKKPTVEVRYEGDTHKSIKQNNAKATAAKKAAVSATTTTTAAPAKSEKAKGKERAETHDELLTAGKKSNTSALPGSFIMIAGSYEKLLYGIEGSYPQAGEQEDDGEVNRVVKPDLTPIFIFPAHLAFVKAIAASPGGKWLATGSEDEFIKVWDLRRRKEVGSLSQHTGKSSHSPRDVGVKALIDSRINHFTPFPYFFSSAVDLRGRYHLTLPNLRLVATQESQGTFGTGQLR